MSTEPIVALCVIAYLVIGVWSARWAYSRALAQFRGDPSEVPCGSTPEREATHWAWLFVLAWPLTWITVGVMALWLVAKHLDLKFGTWATDWITGRNR